VLALGAGLWLAFDGPPGGPWNAEVLPRAVLGFFAGQVLWRLWQVRAWQAAGAVWLALAGWAWRWRRGRARIRRCWP
jgi:hypothetical protein